MKDLSMILDNLKIEISLKQIAVQLYERDVFLAERFEDFSRKVMNRKRLQNYQKNHSILGYLLESWYKLTDKINQFP